MEIRLENISKSFGGKCVLQGLDWQVQAGTCWRLAGASGAGKTTLLRLLMGLERPDTGRIFGLEAMQITASFQEDRLCPWLTARQNLRLVCGAAIEEHELESAYARLLPMDSLDQPARTLSGGMRQRVALLRALLPPSELILLDEPFSGLDAHNITRAVDAIQACRRERTLIFVSHERKDLPMEYQTFSL